MRYLRKKGNQDPTLYPHTVTLANRKDMVECDGEGNVLDVAPEPQFDPSSQVMTPQLIEEIQVQVQAATTQVKTEIVSYASQYGVTLDANAPVHAMLDELLAAVEVKQTDRHVAYGMTKAELTDFAKEKHNADLDGTKRVAELKVDVLALDGVEPDAELAAEVGKLKARDAG